MYTNVTNVIVRLTCPGGADNSCSRNSILLNSHFDTTLASPGAADDAAGIAVMLEAIRVLSLEGWEERRNGVVFLFNGAEETLQDATHAFITNHELKDSIRAVINLEACGTTGREILFQANSREMIEAYKRVPYPHGTVMVRDLANDVFRTGLVLSDTDFRQFVHYGNLTGLDMALYKNSYLYHTHLDQPGNMEPGALQHMGENTLALIEYLTNEGDLERLEVASDVVYWEVFGLKFIVYSWSTAYNLQQATVVLSLLFFTYIIRKSILTTPYRSLSTTLTAYGISTISVLLSFFSAILVSNLTAFVLVQVLDRPMVWYSREWYGLLVYGPAALAGLLGMQLLVASIPFLPRHPDPEHGTFVSVALLFTILTALVTEVGLASSFVLWIYTVVLTSVAVLNEFVLVPTTSSKRGVSSWAYTVSMTTLGLLYTDMGLALIDLFVPLTGRMGVDAPVDHIVAVIVGMMVFMAAPNLLAFANGIERKALAKCVVGLLVMQAVIVVVAAVTGGTDGGVLFPFDNMHPKRAFVQHLKNLTSGEAHLYIAQADHGPFFDQVIHKLEDAFGVLAEHRALTHFVSDWDSIYPFRFVHHDRLSPVVFSPVAI
ncbi:hypothetical protein BC936DRAFT_141000 [Jimgerdemannia flammicorona]|uniref:Peptide hydrolase n=1 Tax=Jimgerdemannia flammicorona TaxID=994334 RepID=A0A433A319_9FUNG|nr:hypothetical protein BC936DRAFT_141000 [Jimgerdemannia flammicorona]